MSECLGSQGHLEYFEVFHESLEPIPNVEVISGGKRGEQADGVFVGIIAVELNQGPDIRSHNGKADGEPVARLVERGLLLMPVHGKLTSVPPITTSTSSWRGTTAKLKSPERDSRIIIGFGSKGLETLIHTSIEKPLVGRVSEGMVT